MPRPVRKLLLLSSFVLLAYALSAAIMVVRLTRRAGPRLEDEPPPPVAGLLSQRIRTDDGEVLGAWYVPGEPTRPWVLLLHGNGGSRLSLTEPVAAHARRGDGVLAVSLRAHGDSSGDRHEVGFDSREDVRAAVAWLRARAPESTVVISAFSLGAAATLFAAEALGDDVQGYLLDAPYASLQRAVRNRTRSWLPWGLEWLAYQGLCLAAPLSLSRPLAEYTVARGLAMIPANVPVTLVGSRGDRACTPDELEELTKVRRGTRLVLTQGEGHRPLWQSDLAHYLREFDRLVQRAPRAASAEPVYLQRSPPRAAACPAPPGAPLEVATEPRLWRGAWELWIDSDDSEKHLPQGPNRGALAAGRRSRL